MLLEEGVEFRVQEQWSGADCTQRILVELLVACESGARARTRTSGVTAEFLRQMIQVRSAFEPVLVKAFLDYTMRTLTSEGQKPDMVKKTPVRAGLV